MSDPQIQEPATSGRVSLRTTKGNLDIELWSRECPLACRNFVQLCKEGYYNGSIFHRIIKDFLVQTGDPSGSGTTCESVFGEPFADEINQRLRYRYRGMVGVANAGKGTNGSQFFITLGPQEGLNGKNTLFGRVVGSSIYTVVDISEVEVDINDRPASDYPPKILECIIIDDPFPEVRPRTSEKVQSDISAEQSEPVERSKLIKAKRTNILSFANEEEEERITAATAQEARISSTRHFPEKQIARASGELDLDESGARRTADAAVLEEIAMIENELRSLSSISKPAAEEQRSSSNLHDDLVSSGKRRKQEKSESVVKQLKSWAKSVSTSSSIRGGASEGENVGSGDWLKSVGKVKFAVDSKNAFKIL